MTAAPTRVSQAGRLLYEGAGLLLAVPLWVWWACWRGAFPTTVWAPGVIYLAAAAIVLAATVRPAPLRGARAVALGALAGAAALAALSMLWAPDPGAAWVGTERLVLYSLSLALPLIWPPSREALVAGVAAFPFAALLGGVSAIGGALDRPASLEAGRLVGPTSYANASGALFLMGAFPAIVLASRRERSPVLRVALLVAAGVLVALAVLTQSRGTVIGTVVAVAVALVVVRERLRLTVPLALVALVVGLLTPQLLDVRTTAQAGDPSGAVNQAVAALIAVGVAMALLGSAYVLLDRRLEPGPQVVRRGSRAARAALAAAVLAGAIVFVATQGSPVSWAQDRWKDFKTPDYSAVETGSTRFSSGLGSNRYDYWRASMDIAADHPLGGVGADNFSSAYLELRRTQKAPLYSHSVWLSALSELGIPGLALAIAFVAALGTALLAALRRADPAGRAVVAAAALPAVYLVTHSSGDFIHAFPPLVLPALGLAAAATGAGGEAVAAARRRAPRIALAALALLAAITTLPVFLSASLAARAAATWPDRPAGALDDLDRASDIDPLSSTAPLQEGLVAAAQGDRARARRAFEEAARRDSKGWFARLELAILAAQDGDRPRALRLLDEVARLNPREPALATTRAGILRGRPPDPLVVAEGVVRRGG